MKQTKKITIILILFVISMFFIILFFIRNYERINLNNKSKQLLNYAQTLEAGDYTYKQGIIYSSDGNLINSNIFINGTGEISKDKYNNIKFYINANSYCSSKTSLGKIITSHNSCDKFKTIEIKYSKNNTILSFETSSKNLKYMISNKDNFSGDWVYQDYEDNIILNFYDSGDKYIWFKDEEGNISDVINFSVECFNADNSIYDSKMYYCEGSLVSINNESWVVLNDSKSKINLLKLDSLEEKMSHCLDEDSIFCYYNSNKINEYRWSNSYINYYLNNIYIDSLGSIKDKLLSVDICDNAAGTNGCDSNDGCGGYTKDVIERNNWSCEGYTSSLIRLLSYYDYNSIYNKIENKNYLLGNYWTMTPSISGKGSSIQNNGDFYVLEDLKNKLDVRPVITLSK